MDYQGLIYYYYYSLIRFRLMNLFFLNEDVDFGSRCHETEVDTLAFSSILDQDVMILILTCMTHHALFWSALHGILNTQWVTIDSGSSLFRQPNNKTL